MELHEIRYFLTLSKTLNFTKAAEMCNVSQPALTGQFRRWRTNSADCCFPVSAITRI